VPTDGHFTVLPAISSERTISRRALAQTFFSAIAAGFTSPLFSALHPIRRHLLDVALLDLADDHLPANGEPLFLSAQQIATLDVLSEAIVPGALRVRAAQFIDLLLSADTHDVQQNFLAALNASESASQDRFHVTLFSLTATQLHDLLVDLSGESSSDRKHFENLKDWIAGAYYSSEIGLRELGWTPDRVFPQFPSCPHSEGHV
jgi:hypothetical protein